MAIKTSTDGLSPEIGSWLDHCLVPLLVREYIAELEKQDKIRVIKNPEVTR